MHDLRKLDPPMRLLIKTALAVRNLYKGSEKSADLDDEIDAVAHDIQLAILEDPKAHADAPAAETPAETPAAGDGDEPLP